MNKKTIISAVLGALIFTYLIKISNIDTNIIYSIQNPVYILLAAILTAICFPLFALRMKCILKAIKKENIPLLTLTKIEFTSKFIYYVTPSKVYLPVKALLLNKQCSIRKSTGVAVATFEYGLDVSSMLIISIIGLTVFQQSTNISSIGPAKILAILIILTIIFLKIPIDTISKTLNNLNIAKIGIIKKGIKYAIILAKNSKNTWKTILTNRKMRIIIPIMILIWFIGALGIKMLFMSYGINVSIIHIFLINMISTVAGGISQIPGGLGVREGAAVIIYNSIGVAQETTIMVMIIARLMSIIPITVGYYISTKTNKEC
ncbi:MAG: lysylphosphatidylglycerol synthase transmembrane domain-containing protein [archaeon]|nr:lysylphosphatidylglycerol synthase transmembrane domain-containing protein [archaeon]